MTARSKRQLKLYHVAPQGSAATVLPTNRARRIILALTLLAYSILAALYVCTTPLQPISIPDNLPQSIRAEPLTVGLGPDEKEHFLYILSIAHGRMPRPIPELRRSAADYVTYQAQHPPLFFAIGAALYGVFRGLGESAVWYVLRGFCALCGLGVIVLGAEAARVAFPDRPLIALASAPAIAFLPMFGQMMACLSNEPLAMLLTAWAWLQICRMARAVSPPTAAQAALLGLTIGLGAECRLTALLWMLPAVVVFWSRVRDVDRAARLRLLASLTLPFVALIAPYFAYNYLTYGHVIVRPFHRPMLLNISLFQYLADANQTLHFSNIGLETIGQVKPIQIALWYASTACVPYWLIRPYIPGGKAGMEQCQSLFLVAEVVVLLLLYLNSSERRRTKSEGVDDGAGRLLLWSAFGIVALCNVALILQQCYYDWQVVLSAGRYIVAFVVASTLLCLFALSTRLRTDRAQASGACIIAVAMLAFDIATLTLIRQFYQDHPTQAYYQPIAPMN